MTKGSVFTRAQLRAQRLFNSWDIATAAGNKVLIAYSNSTGRMGTGMHVQVFGIGFKTDPKGPWYNYGNKTFLVNGIKDKPLKLLAAQGWASIQGYVGPYTEWERDPFGGWHPKGSILRAWKAATITRLYDHGQKEVTA